MLLALRVLWLTMPVWGGPALVDALDGRSTPVVVVASILAAAGWGEGVVAALVPRSLSLTVLRVVAPLALAAAVWCALAAPTLGAAEMVAVAGGALVAAVVLLVPDITDAFVDGSSYGEERRFALRTPIALLVGPVELAWALLVVPFTLGPLLLAVGQWAAGVALLLVGLVAVVPALRSLHQLARRWLVFVPAGVVLHDPLRLADPVMFPKRMVRAFGPADATTAAGALDATAGATGLVFEIDLTEPSPVGLVSGRHALAPVDADRILFVPLRPTAVLDEARTRRGL